MDTFLREHRTKLTQLGKIKYMTHSFVVYILRLEMY